MMSKTFITAASLAILSVFLLNAGSVAAQQNQLAVVNSDSPAKETAVDRSAAEAFSNSTLVYAEAQPPAKLVKFLLEHPLRERIEAIPQVKAGLKSKEFVGFLTGVGLAQVYTGMNWEESLDTVAGKGLAIGFDPEQNAVGAVFSSRYPEKLPDFYRGLLKLANQNEQTKVNEGEYRGQKAFAVGDQLFMIIADDRVLVANKKPLVKKMLDNWLDQPKSNLAGNESFKAAQAKLNGKTIWTWANLKTIRDSGMAKELFREKTENIGAELIVGGVLEATRSSDEISASLDLQNDGIQLSVLTDLNEADISSQRRYFFGTPDQRTSFERLKLDNTLAEIVAFRDLGRLWLTKEELFEENHLAELSQADSTLSTLFSGLDFGEEVLGSTLPGIQLIARNQDYSELETPQPDIKIPEFAFVLRLKPESEKVQRRFRVAYQSFVGFLNIQLAMQGQPQLELESERMGDARVVSATYLPEEGKEYEGLINYNFSPSVAFADQWFIISSTKQMAADLAKAGLKKSVTNDPSVNTAIKVYGQQAKQILTQNSEQLIAQNMLEEGNDRDEAKAQIDLLLNMVGLIRQVSLDLENSQGQLSLNFGLKLDLNQ